MYLTIGAGGGVTGVEVSSEEQDKTNANAVSSKSSFFTGKIWREKLISPLKKAYY